MESVKFPKPYQILNKALRRKQDKAGGYSQRSLARELSLSPTFLSKVLTGKKVIPTSRIKELCKALDMDINTERYLMQAILYHSLPSEDLRQMAMKGSKPSKIVEYNPQSQKRFGVLKDWYNIAILDLLTCDIEASAKNIAKTMNLPLVLIETALKGLAQEGLAIEDRGLWKKTNLKVSFPTTKLQTEVRGFHKQMITKALHELSKVRPEDFEDRIITGVTIAVNPENLSQAKELIFAALTEVAAALSDGSCQDVYQFNVQLFPLAKTSRSLR